MKKVKVVTMFVLILLISILSGCESTNQQEVKSTLLNSVDSPIVSQIKNLNTPEGIPLGDLIEAGMGSCTYELYDPAEDGNTYVTISGNITYNDIPVVAKLQYKQIGDSEYEFYTLVYNDLPRTELEVDEFFEYLYESYYDQNQAEGAASMDQSSSGTAVVESEVYEFGSKSQFDADFNGDDISDSVSFYFEQTWFFITYVEGTSNTGYNTDVIVPESILDENGEIPVDVETLVSIADLDQNGDYEFMVSYSDAAGIAALTIYDVIDNSLTYVGEIEGQFEFVISNDGEIFAPIGTQGLGDTYRYSNGSLEQTN